jgi:hypothetical protein
MVCPGNKKPAATGVTTGYCNRKSGKVTHLPISANQETLSVLLRSLFSSTALSVAAVDDLRHYLVPCEHHWQ